jgi:hypothetical protein
MTVTATNQLSVLTTVHAGEIEVSRKGCELDHIEIECQFEFGWLYDW